MFDSKEIAAYRELSAPIDLRDKVLSSLADEAPKRNSARFIKQLSSLAACFVLAAVLVLFGAREYGNVSVSVSGEELKKERSVVYNPNNEIEGYSMTRASETNVALTLDGHAELSVSNGILRIFAEDDDTVLYTGTDYAIDGKTLVHWTVLADDIANTYELTLKGAFKTEKIILSYDMASEAWTLTRSNRE